MEKYNRAVDLMEHPEKYSDSEMVNILEDEEIRDIYNNLCMVEYSLHPKRNLSDEEVGKEWVRFADKENIERKNGLGVLPWWRTRNFVAAALCLVIALGAVAIEMTIKSRSRVSDYCAVKEDIATITADGRKEVSNMSGAGKQVLTDTIVVFENESLEKILGQISEFYGAHLRVDNPEAMQIRLFLRWDTKSSKEDIIRRFNNFEKINLTLEKDTVVVH